MDPLTQGVLGTSATQVVANHREKLMAGLLGFFSGAAADLDVLIKSVDDPLLALEYHRQFTHALIFIPIGALLCAGLFYGLIFRKKLTFVRTYIFCFAGYSTHALLDACTTYGTQLLWPFSDQRIAWNNVSVVDPLFTVPLMVLVGMAMLKRSHALAVSGVIYVVFYLSLGVFQNSRAENIAGQLAASRGHQPVTLGVKPSFANLIIWKSVYEYRGRFYVDGIRILLNTSVIEGSSTEKLDLARHFPWLKPTSQQARDVERFRWFSNQHLGIDPDNPQRIIDIRYSLIPNRMDGMWGVVLNRDADQGAHVKWTTTRPQGAEINQSFATLWSMIKG
ncbi:MAG: metal-dependent hydrolase [Gammaproteobacteria bacterium]|nr:metal-dependent hydrolase [Gammaproteobacteria bacterium]